MVFLKRFYSNVDKKTKISFIISLAVTVSLFAALVLAIQISQNNFGVVPYILIFLPSLGLSIAVSRLKKLFSENLIKGIGCALFLLFPFVDVLFISHVNNSYFISNVYIILIPYILLFLIFKLSSVSICFVSILTAFLYLLDDIVLTVRGVGVSFSDIFAIDTALSVSSNYSFHIKEEYIVSVLVAVFFCVSSIIFPFKFKYTNIKAIAKKDIFQDIKAIKKEYKSDFIYFIVMIIIFITLVCSAFNVFITFNHRYMLLDWNTQDGLNETGIVYKLIWQIQASSFSAPEGYSQKEAENILNRYTEEDGERNPNIIVIMNESFSDLRDIADIKLSEENMPFYKSIDKNVTKGNVIINGYGGITANSEFEFLTGISMACMPKNSYPYLQFINKKIHTVVDDLDSSLYQKDYIHPFIASNYKRAYLYPFLGFDKFYDGLSFSTQDAYTEEYDRRSAPIEYEGVDLIRGYIGDETTYDKVIDLYENKDEGKRLAEFIITMQNHGGYTYEGDDFAADITAETASSEVNQYLSLIKKSDDALKKIIDYFSKADEDTVIVFFGDHRPNLNGFAEKDFESAQDMNLAYFSTPFLIWTNFESDTEYIDYVSLNYLSVIMKEKAQISVTKYDKFLMELYEEYPIVSNNFIVDNKNNYFAEFDLTEDSLLADYRILSYYLFDQ